jgi:hypothetical protein
MRHSLRPWFLMLVVLVTGAPAALAQTCQKQDFAQAVDQAGAALRKFNLENQPKLNAKIEALRAKKGWKKSDSEDKALEYLQDGRIAELDAQSNELLTKIDNLGRAQDGKAPDCSKLGELKAAGVEILAVMKAKSAYTLEKIDLEIQGGTASPAKPPAADTTEKPADVKVIAKVPDGKSSEPKPEPPPPARSPEKPPAAPPARSSEKLPAAPPPGPPPVKPLTQKETAEARADAAQTRRGEQLPSAGWETSSKQADRQAMNVDPSRGGPTYDGMAGPDGPGQPYGPPPGDVGAETGEGYTIDEIKEVTRGFFGTISTSLASVIEYSFAKQGRPTAYILGQEGGGAFLAGLRYGNGTLYRRAGAQTEKVYWHGPSLGYDVGAEGSRTLFLIYKLHEPHELYRTFTGVDGSAYVVGGVGLTLLKGGPVFMAPIRSGIGLRLGANLGYIRFTPEPTWNPF